MAVVISQAHNTETQPAKQTPSQQIPGTAPSPTTNTNTVTVFPLCFYSYKIAICIRVARWGCLVCIRECWPTVKRQKLRWRGVAWIPALKRAEPHPARRRRVIYHDSHEGSPQPGSKGGPIYSDAGVPFCSVKCTLWLIQMWQILN